MSFTVQIRNRAYADIILPELTFEVQRFRTVAQGGSQSALIRVVGNETTLWRMLEWLRYEAIIRTENGQAVWWGYINSITIAKGGQSVGVSLENMANRVAVIWSNDTAGDTTGWADSADSQTVYGTKELLISADSVTGAVAEQRRDWELAQRKYPIADFSPGGGGGVHALIECRGWLDSLEWTYYDRDEGLQEHVDGNTRQPLGAALASAHYGFQAGTNILSEVFGNLLHLEKGDQIRLSGTASNNSTFTVESGTNDEAISYTATTIGFTQEQRRVANEYIRGTHNVDRKLNNSNLLDSVSVITTLSAGAATDAEELTLTDITQIASGDRIRIALDAGGHHFAFVTSRPNNDTSIIRIEPKMPSAAASGKAVDRINRFLTNESGSVVYTETTDYTVTAGTGIVRVLSTGSITNNQKLKFSYYYIEHRIEDSELGLSGIRRNDMVHVGGSASNNGYKHVLTTGSEGDYFTVQQAVTDEGPGNSVIIRRGNSVKVEEALTTELPDGSTMETLTVVGQQVAQKFTVASDENWTLNQVEVRLRKIGTPSDNVQVALHADSAGAVGSSIESATVVGDSLSSGSAAWTTFQFANTSTLTAGTAYWLVVSRTGTASLLNAYEVLLDEDIGLAPDTLRVWNGAAWVARIPDANMPFRLLGSEATDEQIAKIVSQEGQFLTGDDIHSISNLETNQFRAGRTTALSDLIDLLEMGTANDVRYLSTVTIDRMLKVEEEPTQPDTASYYLRSDGTVADTFDRTLLRGDLSFVGKWMDVRNVIPATANVSGVGKPVPFLVEAAEYDAIGQRYRIEPRHGATQWRIGMIEEG